MWHFTVQRFVQSIFIANINISLSSSATITFGDYSDSGGDDDYDSDGDNKDAIDVGDNDDMT